MHPHEATSPAPHRPIAELTTEEVEQCFLESVHNLAHVELERIAAKKLREAIRNKPRKSKCRQDDRVREATKKYERTIDQFVTSFSSLVTYRAELVRRYRETGMNARVQRELKPYFRDRDPSRVAFAALPFIRALRITSFGEVLTRSFLEHEIEAYVERCPVLIQPAAVTTDTPVRVLVKF
jgi:hypothetical protein